MAMTCKELVELVTDYLEGKLPDVEVIRFEQHLSSCEGCTNYLEQMRQTVRAVAHARQDVLTPQQWQDLLKLFRDWKNG